MGGFRRQGQREAWGQAIRSRNAALPAGPESTSAHSPTCQPPIALSVGPLAHARLGATTGIPVSVWQPTWQPFSVDTRHTQRRC